MNSEQPGIAIKGLKGHFAEISIGSGTLAASLAIVAKAIDNVPGGTSAFVAAVGASAVLIVAGFYTANRTSAILLKAATQQINDLRAVTSAHALEAKEALIAIIEKQTANLTTTITNIGVQPIDNLRDVYACAERMIDGAKASILDTTWGPEIHRMKGSSENEAFRRYRDALVRATTRDVTIQDLFGLGSQTRKQAVIKALISRTQLPDKVDNHKIRVARLVAKAPLIDFLVADSHEALLSFNKTSYCYIRSPPIVEMLREYFCDSWNQAVDVSLSSNDTDVLADDRQPLAWDKAS